MAKFITAIGKQLQFQLQCLCRCSTKLQYWYICTYYLCPSSSAYKLFCKYLHTEYVYKRFILNPIWSRLKTNIIDNTYSDFFFHHNEIYSYLHINRYMRKNCKYIGMLKMFHAIYT